MRPLNSASNLQRRFLCPGSGRLESGLPDDDSKDSQEGTLLHNYSHHTEYDRTMLTPDQRDVLELSDSLTQRVIERVGKPELPFKQFAEVTLKMRDSEFTGTPDLVRYYASDPFPFAVVLDRKFGRNFVEPADVNLQLRSYSVMSYDYSGNRLDRVYAAIVQPRATYDARVTLAEYEPEVIDASREQITEILAASNKKNAKLVAGEVQCRRCKAKLICPEFKATFGALVPATGKELFGEIGWDLSKAKREAMITEKLSTLSDAQLEGVKVATTFSDWVKGPCNDEIRRRGGTENYEVGKASVVREIADVQRAIALLEMAGVATREAILSFCSVPLGKLEEAYRTAHPGLTWQEAKDKINKVLSPVIEKQEIAPKIIRK